MDMICGAVVRMCGCLFFWLLVREKKNNRARTGWSGLLYTVGAAVGWCRELGGFTDRRGIALGWLLGFPAPLGPRFR